MPAAEGLAPRIQQLAIQRLGCLKVALGLQQPAEVADGHERVRMPIAERFAPHLQRLAAQKLSGGEVAHVLQQHAEVADGGKRVRMPIAERLAPQLQRLAVQQLGGGEVALVLQQLAEAVDRDERAWMPITERRALPLQRLSAQRLRGGEVALGVQQRAEVADGDERVRMLIAERVALHLQSLAVQQLSGGVVFFGLQQYAERLSGGEVALVVQQRAEVADGDERVQMPIAVRLPLHLQHLAEQRLGLVELALDLQLHSERTQGEVCGLAIRTLGLEPCTQKLEAQRIAVMVHALAAAVGCVLVRARAPPFLEAVFVDQLGGAAAGARLHERAVVFITPAQPARLLLHDHSGGGHASQLRKRAHGRRGQ
eukprot:scaffold42617_cov57-Phaeocystis_antarctica.AAC.3